MGKLVPLLALERAVLDAPTFREMRVLVDEVLVAKCALENVFHGQKFEI